MEVEQIGKAICDDAGIGVVGILAVYAAEVTIESGLDWAKPRGAHDWCPFYFVR